MSQAVTQVDLDIALNQRVGPVEHDVAVLRRDLSKQGREIADTKDLIVKMLTPVAASLDLLQKQSKESASLFQKQIASTQRQIRKLFSMAKKKSKKPVVLK